MARQYWMCDFGCGYHSESKNDVERHEDRCDLAEEDVVTDDEDDEDDEPIIDVILEEHE